MMSQLYSKSPRSKTILPRIRWTPETDVRLFLTILATHDITVDHATVAGVFGASPTAIAQRIYKLRQKAKELLESEDEDEDEDDESDEEEMPAGNHPNAATPDKAALAGVGVAAPTKKRVKNPKNLRITPPSPGSDVDDIVIVKKGKEGPTVPSRLLKPGASKAVSLEEEKKKKKKKAVQIGRVGKKRAPARFGINGRIV